MKTVITHVADDVRKNGLKAAGQTTLIKHLDGVPLTASQRIKSKCYECMGYYADGRRDCNVPTCPLYPLMPYREDRKKKALGVVKNTI